MKQKHSNMKQQEPSTREIQATAPPELAKAKTITGKHVTETANLTERNDVHQGFVTLKKTE